MSKKEASLFVDAEDQSSDSDTDVNIQPAGDSGYHEISSDDEVMEEKEDDPVVESIPLFINNVPDRDHKSLHLLQYLGKPKSLPQKLRHISAGLKPESNFIQVKLPLDTTRFYDESKEDEWGVKVQSHDHTGVLNKTNGGIYAAKFVVVDGQKQVVLLPVDSTTQLRPSFKYLDDIENLKVQQRRDTTDQSYRSTQSVHILQSSAKNNKNTANDPLLNSALGESLKHVRRFDQEPWVPVNWTEESQESLTKPSEKILETANTMDDYIVKLTNN